MDKHDFKFYGTEELAKILKVTKRTILRYCETGQLIGRKIGGKWAVSQKNLQLFIDAEA